MNTDMTDEEWVESMRAEHESDKEWAIRRSFLLAHMDKYSRERLICLANCFINMEVYGCQYPDPVTQEVRGLAAQLNVLEEYRREKKQREANRQQFVKGSTQPGSDLTVKMKNLLNPPLTQKRANKGFVIAQEAASKKPNIPVAMETLCRPDKDVGGYSCSSSRPRIPQDYELVYQQVEQHIKLNKKAIEKAFRLKSDLKDSLILLYSPMANSMLSGSAGAIGVSLDCVQDGDLWKLATMDRDTLAQLPVSRLADLVSSLGSATSRKAPVPKRIGLLIGFKVLQYLMTRCYILIRKNLSLAKQALTTESLQTGTGHPTEISKGKSLLKSLGWTEGSGLGARSQGITTPVHIETTINRQGIGYSGSERNLQRCASAFFNTYVRSGRTDLLVFSSDFSTEDRKILHNVARKFNLKAVSRGQGDSRCLTVQHVGRSLGASVKDMEAAGIRENDWCIIFPPASKITWQDDRRNETL